MARPLHELQRMDATQLNRLTKEVLIASIQNAQPPDAAQTPVSGELKACMDAVMAPLLAELRELRTTLTRQLEETGRRVEMTEQRMARQDERIAKQDEVIASHQRDLERSDQRERECNLIVLGVPDTHEALDGATEEQSKLEKIWRAADIPAPMRSWRRLGGDRRAPEAGPQGRPHRRPILVSVASREERDEALRRARRLKDAGGAYATIFIKKDVHPSVRTEWNRLRESERREKARPENQGCNVYLNTRERKLYKDDIVIDQWSTQHFR